MPVIGNRRCDLTSKEQRMNKGLPEVKSIARATLADQMVADITERILSGSMLPGSALPAEPILAHQYGVSRSVVRDANRMLAAQGLVEIRRGRGVFVTDSQRQAFSDAFLLALRREGASVWDVEEFEQILLPTAISLAAERATDSEIAGIRSAINSFLNKRKQVINQLGTSGDVTLGDLMLLDAGDGFGSILQRVYDATHNVVLSQFAGFAVALRSWREWVELSIEEDLELDVLFCTTLMRALETRDRAAALAEMATLWNLPPEAVGIMKRTPIGEIPRIKG